MNNNTTQALVANDNTDLITLLEATDDSNCTATRCPLPPLIRQVAAIAPDDFVSTSILCMLPMLGTLGTKLRAVYLDGRMHSPSFQVTLEAPQASGKSFITRISEALLAPIIARDKEALRQEREYNDRMAELNRSRKSIKPEEREALLGQRPNGIVRFLPSTTSITKLLMRMENARGLHLFALAEEIDTVNKAFKRAVSSYGDLLRVAFDNSLYGQDYASVDTYSGLVHIYYNTLFSGTPKAIKRFYPDEEDGLVSRVCFVTLPDQFGKPMPVWGKMNQKDIEEVNRQVNRLEQVSIIGDTVQPDHVMDLTFLNRDLALWIEEQQTQAVRENDRARDTFCRRSAVVGFRAGMLAWFLYGEKDTAKHRKDTIAFARWVANQMLMQHLLRFTVSDTGGNVQRWDALYAQLPDEFSRDELTAAMQANGISTGERQVIYNWSHLNLIETLATQGNKSIRFRKRKT